MFRSKRVYRQDLHDKKLSLGMMSDHYMMSDHNVKFIKLRNFLRRCLMIDCYLCTKNSCVKGEHYTGIWGLKQTILSKSWGNLIYRDSVNDSSRNFSSLVSSGCKNVSNSSFANSFSSSDGMCHWMFRLKRSPGFPQSYTWRKKNTS